MEIKNFVNMVEWCSNSGGTCGMLNPLKYIKSNIFILVQGVPKCHVQIKCGYFCGYFKTKIDFRLEYDMTKINCPSSVWQSYKFCSIFTIRKSKLLNLLPVPEKKNITMNVVDNMKILRRVIMLNYI